MSGKVVILDGKERFNHISPFHEWRAAVSFAAQPDGFVVQLGFIDDEGEVVLARLAKAENLSDGRAPGQRLESRVHREYVDWTGCTVLPDPYGCPGAFSEGSANGAPLADVQLHGGRRRPTGIRQAADRHPLNHVLPRMRDSSDEQGRARIAVSVSLHG